MFPVAPVTVIDGQFDPEQGPLPPVAQPLASARLNKAAANKKFFIVDSLLEVPVVAMFPDHFDPERLPVGSQRAAGSGYKCT